MNVQTLDLDIGKRGNGQCIRIGQGDSGGTTITATIYDNGSPVSLSGASANLCVRLPDRMHYYRGKCSISGSVVTHVCEESRLASVPGFTDEAYFELIIGSQTFSTERFSLDIMRSALDGQVPSQSWDDAVQDLIDRGETAVKNANSAASAANTAANKANAAANAANTATSKANAATSAANTAAASANAAAASANGAADDATAAAQNALNIANSIAAIKPPSDDEVQELRDANAVLATAVAQLKDDYVVIKETAYMPVSRRSALSGETLAVAQAIMSGETATLN